ncbi:DUF6531 domain-containing protein, partial [Pseudomonas monteilii]
MDRCSGVVAPKETFDEEDVKVGAEMLAKWLTDLTGDAVNWRTVISVGEMLPVAGSIFAATDAIGDIIELAKGDNAYRADPFNWVGLGINLFAIAPLPGVGPARKVMRPALKSLRTASRDGIPQALLKAIEGALAHVCPGELEAFIAEIEARLQSILASFAEKIVEVCRFLADLIRSVADGTVKDVALTALFPGMRLVAEASDFFKRKTGFGFSKNELGFGESEKLKALLEPIAQSLESIGRMAGDKVVAIGNKADSGSIASILGVLRLALSRRANTPRRSNIAPGSTSQSRNVQGRQATEAAPGQRATKADPNCKKRGAKAGTNCSISFATGSETIVHTDFQLPGVFPIEWNRTYRSSLSAFDSGPYGARWITPFATRFDLNDDQLTYHGTDGRSQKYSLPKLNGSHYDAIENVVIARTAIDTLALLRGHESQEIYQRHGNQFRLSTIKNKGGSSIALHYEHRVADTAVLSDLVTYQHDTPHQHIHTQIDDQGRIIALWLMHEGQP